MSLGKTFSKFAADLRAKCAASASYRRAYKVLNATIRVGDTDAVRTLLDDGVIDVNKPPRGTAPAIAIAVQENQNEIFDMLMREGADPNTVLGERGLGYIQHTPLLSLAIIHHNEHAAKQLLAHPWIDASQSGDLIAIGSVHGSSGYATRETPLDLAKQEGMDDIAKLIAAHPSVRNDSDQAPPRKDKRHKSSGPHHPAPQH